MARNQSSGWAYFFRVFLGVTVVVMLLCGLTVVGAVVWNQLWHVPRLVYSVLPTYVVREQNVQGLVVENRGQSAAHDVVIRIVDLEVPIETFTIKTSEVITAKDGDERNITVRLERVVPGSSVTLYIPTADPVPIKDFVTITSEEGSATPSTARRDMTEILTIGIIVLSLGFLLLVGGAMGWVLARLSARS